MSEETPKQKTERLKKDIDRLYDEKNALSSKNTALTKEIRKHHDDIARIIRSMQMVDRYFDGKKTIMDWGDLKLKIAFLVGKLDTREGDTITTMLSILKEENIKLWDMVKILSGDQEPMVHDSDLFIDTPRKGDINNI